MPRAIAMLLGVMMMVATAIPSLADEGEYDPSTNPDSHNPSGFEQFSGVELQYFAPPTDPGIYGEVPEDGTVDLYVYVGETADNPQVSQAIAAFQSGVGEGVGTRNLGWWPGFFFTSVPVTPGLADRIRGMLNSPLTHSVIVLPSFSTATVNTIRQPPTGCHPLAAAAPTTARA